MSEEVEKYVAFFLENNIEKFMSHECIYRNNIQSNGKSYFKYNFKPNEKVEFILGYAVSE